MRKTSSGSMRGSAGCRYTTGISGWHGRCRGGRHCTVQEPESSIWLAWMPGVSYETFVGPMHSYQTNEDCDGYKRLRQEEFATVQVSLHACCILVARYILQTDTSATPAARAT